MIQGVLFDKDGTLLEFADCWHYILSSVVDTLEKRHFIGIECNRELRRVAGLTATGFESDSLAQHCTTAELAQEWSHAAAQYKAGSGDFLPAEYLRTLIDEEAVSERVPIVPVEGAPELLDYCRNRGLPVGVVTADTEVSTRHSLSRAGFLPYLSYLATQDSPLPPKPDPASALLCCRQWGVAPHQVLYLGDSERDMLFAANSGMPFVGVVGPHNDGTLFTAAGYPTVVDLTAVISLIDTDAIVAAGTC